MDLLPARFTDRRQRAWRLELNYTLGKHIQDVTGLDFINAHDGKALMGVIQSDETLVQTLWLFCEEQAGAASIDETEFGRGLDGPTLEQAINALEECVLNFSRPARRAAIQAVREKAHEVEAAQAELVATKVRSPALIAISAGAWTVLGAIKAGVAAINTWLAATLTAEGLAALWASIQTMVLSGAMGVLTAVTSAAAAVLTFFTTPLGLIVLAVTLVGLALAGGAKLGFEPIQGLQFVDNWAAGASEKAGQMKAATARNREQEVAASRDRLAQAQGRLDDATQAAKQARKDQAEKRKKKLSGLLDHVGQSSPLPVTAPGGSALGTFSAAVAGLLGRSGPDTAAERTANATEAMEEHLAAIRDDIEEGGLAFE